MILDGYWKKELERNIRSLETWLKLSCAFSDYTKHQVNKAILYSAIIMRKMFEDEKGAEIALKKADMPIQPLTLLNYKVKVTVYPFVGDKSFIAERVIPDNYDCNNVVEKEIELNTLCNQIIHSFVWTVVYEQKKHKISGVLFASDKVKDNVLYLLKPQEFIKAMQFCIVNGNI